MNREIAMKPHVIASGSCWIKVAIGEKMYEYILSHPDDVDVSLRRFRNNSPWKAIQHLKDTCIECNRLSDPPVINHHRKPDMVRIVEVRDMPKDVNPVRVAFDMFSEEKRFGFHFGKIFIYDIF